MKLKTLKEKIGLLYNKVSSRKENAVEYVRRKCDDIPPQKRFRVVAVAFVLFTLLALFVFGKSIYNIYNGVSISLFSITVKFSMMNPLGLSSERPEFFSLQLLTSDLSVTLLWRIIICFA